MPKKRLPRPRDPIQLGKLVVDIATGAIADRPAPKRKRAKRKPVKKKGAKRP